MYKRQPLESSPNFDGLQNTNVFFKCENLQYTGSFKVRGALSKGFTIQNKDLLKGVVTASTGNHGAATAFALSKIGYKGTIFVPENASKVKISNIERHGGIIKFHGSDSGETEFFARNYAKKNNLIYLPPYNDPQVIGGQGTIAIELKNQLKKNRCCLCFNWRRWLDFWYCSLLKAYFSRNKDYRMLTKKFTGNDPVRKKREFN